MIFSLEVLGVRREYFKVLYKNKRKNLFHQIREVDKIETTLVSVAPPKNYFLDDAVRAVWSRAAGAAPLKYLLRLLSNCIQASMVIQINSQSFPL